jgi:hypothetical protein
MENIFFKFKSAITSRWGKFLGDSLLDPSQSSRFAPVMSPVVNLNITGGLNNQLDNNSQSVFPNVSPVDAINWADNTGRIGLATVSAIREEGVLNNVQRTGILGGTGTRLRDYTVPSGKKWVLKAVAHECTATTSAIEIDILDTAGITIPVGKGLAATYSNFNFNSITLPAGWTVRFAFTASIDGATNTEVLYMESNA